MCRFARVTGGLERSFTGSDVAADVFRTEVVRASPSPVAGSLVAFARVEGGRAGALLVAIELALGGLIDVEVPGPVDMVVLRGLMVGKRLGDAVFSGDAATDDLSGRLRLVILSEGLRIDLVLDGMVDMI